MIQYVFCVFFFLFCALFAFLYVTIKMLRTWKRRFRLANSVGSTRSLSLKLHFPFYSEDGFYSAAFRAPASGGQWNVEAISVSPLHGLRVSKTRSVRRTRPLDIIVTGVPVSVKRNETIRDVTVAVRNNMPVPMQVSHIVINKLQGSGFSSLL